MDILNKNMDNPWAGLSSYEDPEKAEREGRKPKLFCGRNEESHDVSQLIVSNIFVTLYGKSGTGKTSLLNAGIFPRLRQKRYLPVSIRLSMDARDISFQKAIINKLSNVIGCQQTVNVVPLPDDEQRPDYLWSYFARTRFFNADGLTIFPVIVLDQFEEVFRNRRLDAEALLRQIAYLMDESHALGSRIVDGQSYQYDFNFRFVASIREDDLCRLEDSIDNNYLPELKRCRYRLRGFTEKSARDAILIPGEGLFKMEDSNGIVAKIIDKSRNKDGSIGTNIVSLLCCRVFVEFQCHKNVNYISQKMVDDFIKGNPIEQFYSESVRELSHRERTYIEEHLIDSTGRRNSIPESDFLHKVKRGAKLLEGNTRVLQYTGTSSDGGNRRVELIHDSFCEAIMNIRRKRDNKRKHYFYVLLFLLALFLVGETVYMACSSEEEQAVWTIRMQQVYNPDEYYWKTQIHIIQNDEKGDTCKADIISFDDWENKKMTFVPDSTTKRFIVKVRFIAGEKNFFDVPDTTIDVNKKNKSHEIIREIKEAGFESRVLTKLGNTSIPVQNATIILKGILGHTDAQGNCRMKLSQAKNNDNSIIILREGYLSIYETWNNNDTIYYMERQKAYIDMAKRERLERMERLDKKKPNYTQTLTLRRNNGDQDKIYLQAYVDTTYTQRINGEDRKLEIIKGCYYYHAKDTRKWKTVPIDKIYLLDGYVDESSKTDKTDHCTYFFEGTDMANNKQQLLGVANGDAPWKNGQLIIPGDVNNSGTYENEKKENTKKQNQK